MKTHFVVRITKFIDDQKSKDGRKSVLLHKEVIQTTSLRAAKLKANKIFEAHSVCQTIKDNWGKMSNWHNNYSSSTKTCSFWTKTEPSERTNVYLTVYLLEEDYKFGLGIVSNGGYHLRQALKALKEERSGIYDPEGEKIETYPAPLKDKIEDVIENVDILVEELNYLHNEYRTYLDSLTNLKEE